MSTVHEHHAKVHVDQTDGLGAARPLTAGEAAEWLRSVPPDVPLSHITREIGTQRDPEQMLVGLAANWDPRLSGSPPLPEPSSEAVPEDAEGVEYPWESDGRCMASTWLHGRPKLPRNPARVTHEHVFGPGGYNRCIYESTPEHDMHQDEWGHRFRLNPTGGITVVSSPGGKVRS